MGKWAADKSSPDGDDRLSTETTNVFKMLILETRSLAPEGNAVKHFLPGDQAIAKHSYHFMPKALQRLDIMEGPVARGYVGYE